MKHPPPVVLVVHPEAEERTSLYALLAADGHAVATRSGGFEALEYISRHRPEAVLASTHLPDSGVKEFLRGIGRAGFDANTILLAGPDDWEVFAHPAGAMEVLAWPGRKKEILAAVGRRLERGCP
jgi:DNA-binding NtrC family response regulator